MVDYSNVPRREESFKEWKLQHPDAEAMSNAGFFHTEASDTVECYGCGVRLSDWREGDKPKSRHREATTHCPVVESFTSDREDDDGAASVASGMTSDSGLGDTHPVAAAAAAAPLLPTVESDDSEPSTVGASLHVRDRNMRRRRPRSPAPIKYKQSEERRNSFLGVDWPSNLDAQPEKLVKAGFYFYARPDRVKCAFCGGRLRNWQPRDSAIEEHIKHFPDCTFVQNIEKQTAVLSKNVRSKSKSSNCVSSDTLIREKAEERAKSKRPHAKDLWRKTCRKMGNTLPVIKKAERRLRHKKQKLELASVLEEINAIEKEEFLGLESAASEVYSSDTDEGLSSGSEGEDVSDEPCSVDEQVRKLQSKLKTIEDERDELQNLMLCKICLSNRADTLFLTCRHFATCHDCADRVRDCPVCRQLILGTVDVFMT